MKLLTTLFAIIIICSNINAQKFEWVTATKQGQTNVGYAPVDIDLSGNSYTLIGTSGGLPVIIQQDTFPIPGPGTSGLCVAKFDQSGNILWGKMFSSSNSFGGDITVDEAGSVYFSARLDDVNTYSTDTVYNNNGLVHQVIKLSTNGDFIKTLFAPNTPSGTPLVVAQDTYVYICQFGTIEKRDSSLNVIWSQAAQFGSVAFDASLSCGIMLESNKLVAVGREGGVGTAVAFANDSLYFSLSGPFNENLIVAMDTSGQLLWQYSIPYNSATTAIAEDSQGNVYAGVSNFTGTVIFSSDTLINNYGPGSPYSAILKWDDAGNPLNATPVYSMGAPPPIYDMDVNANNEVLFTIFSIASSISGTILPYNDLLVKLDATGTLSWYKTAINNYSIKMDGIRVRNGNEYIVAGGTDVALVAGCISVNSGGSLGNLIFMVSEQNENYPVAMFTSTNNGFSFDFTDQSSNALSWLWNFGDGDTSILQNPSHSYAAGGNYTVTLTVFNGACSSVYTYQIVGLGIEDANREAMISISQNPTFDKLIISCPPVMNHINIIDITGKIVREIPVEPLTEYSIDVSNLNPGYYTVQMLSEKTEYVKSFVKL